MFSENKRKKYARLLDLDEDELKEFIKRYVYYLRSKKEISPNSVLNGYFILADLRYKKDQTKALRAKYKTKNKYIILSVVDFINNPSNCISNAHTKASSFCKCYLHSLLYTYLNY